MSRTRSSLGRSTGALLVSAALIAGAAPQVAGGEAPEPDERWIVYNGSAGAGVGIRLVRPDGTDDHALFESVVDGESWHPDWSRDGQRIAFAADDTDGTRDLWVGTVDGSHAERVFDCAAPCSWSDDPAWSPDDQTILFQSGSAIGDGLGVSAIEIIDLDSGEARTVLTGGAGEYFYVPRWSPDGRSVVVEIDRFASARLDDSEILETTVGTIDLSAAEAGVRQLVANDRRATYPDWSPDGEHIVFQAPVDPSLPDGASDLFVVPAVGGGHRPLTAIGADGRQALQPSWTPEGGVIFVEQDAMFTNVRMAIVDGDGGGHASATGTIDLFGTHPRLRPLPINPADAAAIHGAPWIAYQAPTGVGASTELRLVRWDGTADHRRILA